MAFLLAAEETMGGLATGVDAAADLLSSGSSRLMTSNIYAPLEAPRAVDPIQTQEFNAATRPTITTIEPQMKINIPLMQKLMTPTWTSNLSGLPSLSSEFQQTPIYDEVASEAPYDDVASEAHYENGDLEPHYEEIAESEPYDDFTDSSISTHHTYDSVASTTSSTPNCPSCDFSKGFKALKAMSLGEIAMLAASSFEAQPHGNVVGGLVTSGVNWAHDAQITNQIQQGQQAMQRSQNEWQGQQNQLSYDNQRQMQSTDIDAKKSMQQSGFYQQDIMQNRQFAHETSMQQAGFQQQTTMQQNQFTQERGMQQNQFAQDRTLQANAFAQQTSMSNLDFQHSMAEGKQNIEGNLLNTAANGVFGVINTAITAGVGYLEQGCNQQFQKEMQTTNFNNNIYASGNSATALKIATPIS